MAKKATGGRKKSVASPHPIFHIRFTEGLATRNRLPLDHVIRVLTEIKGMLESVGKQIQRQRGVENPSGDFGLELPHEDGPTGTDQERHERDRSNGCEI